MFSGVTDCYQPLEASYRLTRACLEVCVAHANPAAIITKSALIERDVDVLMRAGACRLGVRHGQHSVLGSGARAGDRALRRDAGAAAARHRDAGAGRAAGRASTSRRSSRPQRSGHSEDIGRRARRGCNTGGLCARAAARVGEAGVRAAVARRAAAGGGPGASPHPRNARRPALRPAFRRARARRGGLRRRDPDAVRDDGARLGFERGMGMVDDAGSASGDVEDVQDDRQAAVAKRKTRRRCAAPS